MLLAKSTTLESEALPVPSAPINPREVADLEAQFPGRCIRPDDVNRILRARSAEANVRAGLAGERGDAASAIREAHRAELEAKQAVQR